MPLGQAGSPRPPPLTSVLFLSVCSPYIQHRDLDLPGWGLAILGQVQELWFKKKKIVLGRFTFCPVPEPHPLGL